MTKRFFVIDVNVFISAFLFTNSKPREALDKAQDSGFVLLSNSIFLELVEVINRPKFNRYLSSKRKQKLISDLTETSIFIEPNLVINECRDTKDNKYLELAVAGQADCIITGDQDLLILNPFRQINIITVQQFLTTY
jgi:putative PIN family toxin of toxin-antitoxin system